MKKCFGYEEVLLFNRDNGRPLQYSMRSINNAENIKDATLCALSMLQCDTHRATIEEYPRYGA